MVVFDQSTVVVAIFSHREELQRPSISDTIVYPFIPISRWLQEALTALTMEFSFVIGVVVPHSYFICTLFESLIFKHTDVPQKGELILSVVTYEAGRLVSSSVAHPTSLITPLVKFFSP